MKSVAQTFRALEAVAELQPIGVSELARRLEMPKSTTQRILTTLESIGWVVRKPEVEGSKWVLGVAPTILAQRVAHDTNLRLVARPVMEALRDRCSEAVHLAISQDREVVVIDQVESTHPIRIHWPIGQHSPVHATSNGKAFVAFAQGEQLDKLYPREFTTFTATTISNAAEFDVELAQVRQRGYAVVRGELRDDIYSFAAPIFDRLRRPIASISAFVPIYRIPKKEEELGQMVKSAAEEITAALRLDR